MYNRVRDCVFGVTVMKKKLPLFFSIVLGLLGGLLIECVLCVSSLAINPFATHKDKSFFTLLCIISILLVLFIIVIAIVNSVYLMNQNNTHGIENALILEIFVFILFFLISWILSEAIIQESFYPYWISQ